MKELPRLADPSSAAFWSAVDKAAQRVDSIARQHSGSQIHPGISSLYVDATDIAQWAQRRDAQDTLPQVIRRLVFATSKPLHVDFPSGEAVQLGGWDGRLAVQDPHPFLPNGFSGWEFGTSVKIKAKADGDYEKRTAESGDLDPSKTTFVFVTPRRWGGKRKWAKARNAERHWQEVRAYDADDLAQWLELAPAVHLWLSTLLGKKPGGATDLQTLWDDWLSSTQPSLGSGLLLAGRSVVVEKIHDWLKSPAESLRIRAESREEAIAVFASAITRLPEDEVVGHFSRALYAKSLHALEQLVVRAEPLIIIADPEDPQLVERAKRNGHHCVLVLGRSDGCSETPEIPRVALDEVVESFEAVEQDSDRARDRARLARRSLSCLRRRLAVTRDLRRPAWAGLGEGRKLLPSVLAGQWVDSCQQDREALEHLTGASYSDIRDGLLRWAGDQDPPFRRVGEIWSVVSKADAYSLLAPQLTSDDLNRLVEVAVDVLGTPDPAFDLPPADRWMANVLIQDQPRHSNMLRRGLVDSFALLGSRDNTGSEAGVPVSDCVSRFVRDLLARANEDWRVWATLSRHLPLVAEASPQEFLGAVESGLAGSDPVIARLFVTKGDPLFSSSPHYGLVWALQTLAWSPDYLSHVAGLLATLERVRPAGSVSTGPAETLQRIFLPWSPETAANAAQRLAVIDGLRSREPDAAWQLMASMLPRLGGVAMHGPTPRWRDWVPNQREEVTQGDYVRTVTEVMGRMIEDAGEVATRWLDLVEATPRFPAKEQDLIVDKLGQVAEGLPREGAAAIADSLRKTISFHRKHPDSHWALPADRLKGLEQLYHRIQSTDPIERCKWLFAGRPKLLEVHENWTTEQDAISRARSEALGALFQRDGLQGVLGLVSTVQEPWALGFVLAQEEFVASDQEKEVLYPKLGLGEDPENKFAMGFATGLISLRGKEWVVEVLNVAGAEWAAEQKASVLLCLRPDLAAWELVADQGPATERLYWRSLNAWSVTAEDSERAARSLVASDRPFKALDLLSTHVDREPPVDLVLEALEHALSASAEQDKPDGSISSTILPLFEYLWDVDSVEAGRLAGLEWQWLPVFPDRYVPRALREALAADPAHFVSLVVHCFHPSGVDREFTDHQPTDKDRAFGRHAYRVFSDWRTLPGQAGETVDSEALMSWVLQAREALREADRLDIGDQKIGEVLSGSPVGSDDAWPHPAVRDVVDKVASPDLELGISIGKFNNRGVHCCDGGASERARAEDCLRYAETIQAQWPRTAAMLRRIAESHQGTAAREARQAELRSDLDMF